MTEESAAPVETTTEDILAFDPFGPSDTDQPASEEQSAEGKPADVTSSADADAGVVAEGQDGGQPPVDPTGTTPEPAKSASPQQANLEELFRQQAVQIAEAVKAAAPAPATADVTPAKAEPKFKLGLPPQIISGLRSEDEGEFAQSMSAVVNGIANHVWEHVTQLYEERQNQLLQRLPTMLQEHQSVLEQQKAVATDFYSKYPTLAAEALRPVVQQAGMLVARARVAAGKPVAWSAELRDEIAEVIFQAAPMLRPAPAKPGTANGTRKQPPFATGTGSRPAVQTQNQQDEFGADLLNI